VGLLNTTLGTRAFRSLLLSLPLLAASVVVMPVPTANAATSPTLGAAGSYSVLAGQTVTNTGPTTMPGDLGVSPGSAVTGFPPGAVGPPGTIHTADFNAGQAQLANTAAFGLIDQNPCVAPYLFGGGVKDLAGANLVPGVYCADAFTLSGTLTLTGTTGVWIFKSAATLITSKTANVVGGDPCNVWWREVSSAVLGTHTSLIGNILASTSITLATGAALNGRALSQTGSVGLDSNTITGSACLTPNTGGPPVTPVTPVVAPPKFTG
jgi:Ice-binding-like